MRILSVKVGAPTDDYSAWIRKIKVAKLIKSLGHEMDFVIYTHKGECNEKILADIPFKYEMVKVTPFNLYSKYFKKLKEGEYDLVFCNGQLTQAVLFLTKFKGPKFVLDRHGDMVKEFLLLEDGFKYNPRFVGWFLRLKLIDFLNFHFVDRITCVSHKMVEDLRGRGLKPEKTAYVTNGINLDRFKVNEDLIQKMKEDLEIQSKMVFTYVGAFEKWQGVENFIEAAEKLKNDVDVAFVIVGGKKEETKGNIRFIPKVPQGEVPNYYALSDVLVMPRPSHPATEVAAPTKFPEYLAMGKPVLTTNVGDAAQFVKDYRCGLVAENSQPESLVDAIMKFKSKIPDELKVMGSNSRKLAEKEFSIDRMAQDLANALEKW
jgi:glycosyltransferase involved in cell wall biosynthesis